MEEKRCGSAISSAQVRAVIGAHRADTHQPFDALFQGWLGKQPLDELFLRRLEHFHSPSTHAQQVFDRLGYFLQALDELGEVLFPVQFFLVECGPALHQQTRHLVLHAHRLLHHHVAVA